MTGYSAGFQEVMSKRMQRIHHKIDVFRAIASFEEQANLKKGDTVHRLAKTLPIVQTYSRGTSMTIGAHTEVDQSLVVNQSMVAPFYVDDLDQLQFNFKYQLEFGEDMAIKLGNYVDGQVLAEAANAYQTIDDATINASSGTSGNAVLINSGNVQRLFAIAQRKLTKARIALTNRFAVLSPELYQSLVDYLAAKNTPMADTIGQNGFIGKYFQFDLYISNATLWTGSITIATQPNDGDTVVFNGNTFTFKTTLGTTAGNVLIGGSASAALTNLVALINAPSVTTANGVAFPVSASASVGYPSGTNNQANLIGVTAATPASNASVITSKGNGAVVVSTNLTASATDGWSTTASYESILFGKKGATDVVIQAEPKIEVKDVPDKLGKNVIPWTLFGIKTFTEGAQQLVVAKVRTDLY